MMKQNFDIHPKDVVSEDVGAPTTALALNKAAIQVAVAGRSVFKIYKINDGSFEFVSNLRVAKNTLASCNDVAWNQVDENILASATPCGAVVTWNLNKSGFSKMDIVYQDHKRTVNKVHFHCNDPWLLLSGSQDSIKVFDLRQNEAVINYSGLNESVRDLQFSPHRANVFVAVQDSGYVQLYDVRKKDRFELCFPAHNGPILACDWHPEQADVVATAGRDQNIKVWNVQSQSPTMQHCIPTMESVSKISWSPDNKNHIASCSLKRDHSINIWSVLRPYIAYARFTEPCEITTGMAWCKIISSLVSVTSNGIMYQLPLSDAYKPLEHANPVGMAINPCGDIALALGNALLRPSMNQISNSEPITISNSSSVNQSTSLGSPQQAAQSSRFPYQAIQTRGRQSLTRRSQDSTLRVKTSSRSQLDVYKYTEMNWFVKTAQEYQLSNRPLAELCDHNAEVCTRLRRFQVCQTWKILKLFYANINTVNTASTQTNNQLIPSSAVMGTTPVVAAKSRVNTASSSNQFNATNNEDQLSIDSQAPNVYSEFSYLTNNKRDSLISRGSKTTFMPNPETLLDYNSCVHSEQSNESTDECLSHETLSYEAFQPKHDICGRVDSLIMESRKNDDSQSSSDSSNHEDDYAPQGTLGNSIKTISTAMAENDDDFKIKHLFSTKAYQFKFYEIIADVIADVLKYHVDNSDVQSAVSILIVLGDRIKNIVDERIPEMDRESWYHSYIDLLSKFQLWNVMAQVINLSPLSNINSINQTSTSIYTTCGTCNRPLNGKVGWICDRCMTKPSECSLCHGVVSGLMAWCQGCYHGGHLVHMSRWFSEHDYCPTGCGHLCEFGQWT